MLFRKIKRETMPLVQHGYDPKTQIRTLRIWRWCWAWGPDVKPAQVVGTTAIQRELERLPFPLDQYIHGTVPGADEANRLTRRWKRRTKDRPGTAAKRDLAAGEGPSQPPATPVSG